MEPVHRQRLAFVDALRGLAFVFMVLNHSAASLLDASFEPHRTTLMYVTVTLAAPLFLFLVGFSMALSHAARPDRPKRFTDYLWTGAFLIATGFVLTAIIAPGAPVVTGGILQTIGFGVICLGPVVPLMASRAFRRATLLLAAAAYAVFVAAYPTVMAGLEFSPLLSRLLFDGFPPWPWISVIVLGLALGSEWVQRGRDDPPVARLCGVASCCLILYAVLSYRTGTLTRLDFGRDFIINGHWMPGPVTALWILGALLGNCLLVHFLSEALALRLGWLRLMGRSAFLLYVVHLLLIRALALRLIGAGLESWWHFIALDAALLGILMFVARVAQDWDQRHMRAHSSAEAAP